MDFPVATKRYEDGICEAMDDALIFVHNLETNYKVTDISTDNDNDSGEIFFTIRGKEYILNVKQCDENTFSFYIGEYSDIMDDLETYALQHFVE